MIAFGDDSPHSYKINECAACALSQTEDTNKWPSMNTPIVQRSKKTISKTTGAPCDIKMSSGLRILLLYDVGIDPTMN